MQGQPGLSSTPYPHADRILGDPWYSSLKQYVIDSTGMAFYANKDEDLARRFRRRLSGFDLPDCAAYLEYLRDPGRGPAEMDALIAELTIGESYFFRHREHFDALRDIVLPDLIARNAGRRQLRIWSAGCAGGAEPYSLSILLRKELAHLLVGWDVSILGTDINRQYLEAARAGRFEEWSFRSTEAELRQACFVDQGKHWVIAPEYKAGVSFQFHNLVENAFPPPLSDCSAFDLIVCRNVMIYFGPELMQRIVRQFHGCLAPGGWLLVGPSEPNMTYFTSFTAVNAPGVTLYQRPVRSPANAAQMNLPPNLLPLPELKDGTAQRPPYESEKPLAKAKTPAPRPGIADLLRLANQGDWKNAVEVGRELVESDNLNALVHFHFALVLEQMGDTAESERSLRKAIYLDRQAALAHYHLGLHLQSRGNLNHAARCFDNTLKALASRPGEMPLTEAGGITVAELSKLAQVRIADLRNRALKERT